MLSDEPGGVMALDCDSSSRYIKGGKIKCKTMCSQGWSPNDLSQNHRRNCLTPDLLTYEIMAHVYNELPRWRLYICTKIRALITHGKQKKENSESRS